MTCCADHLFAVCSMICGTNAGLMWLAVPHYIDVSARPHLNAVILACLSYCIPVAVQPVHVHVIQKSSHRHSSATLNKSSQGIVHRRHTWSAQSRTDLKGNLQRSTMSSIFKRQWACNWSSRLSKKLRVAASSSRFSHQLFRKGSGLCTSCI